MMTTATATFTSTPPSNDERRRDIAFILIGALVFYALNVDFGLYGDSAMYADYSLRRTFNDVTLHLGYYLIVIGSHATFGALFGIPLQETMAWVAVVAGSLTMVVAYLLALELLGDRRTAVWTVLVLGVSGRIVTNATSSEVYMPQTLFALLAFLMFCRGRIVLTAAAAAYSLLISPLSVFAFLFFPVYDYQRAGRIRWGTLFQLAGYALLFYSPYLAVYGYELLWGTRGLLKISNSTSTDPVTAVRNFPKYLFKHYTFQVLLFVPALVAARKHLKFFALLVAVSLPHLYVIFKLTKEDNVFLLNTDFFSAAFIVLGAFELRRIPFGKWVGPALLVAHIAIFALSRTIFSFEHHRGYAAEMRDISERFQRNRNATIITDWGTAAAFAYYARDTAKFGLLQEPVFERLHDLDNNEPNDLKLQAPELFVLDRWNPMPLNRLLSSEESLKQQRSVNGLKEIAEGRYNLQCTLLEEKTNRLYQCVRKGPVSAP